MKLFARRPACTDARRRGAALLLSLLILLVLVAIVIQINVSTGTDARIARNDVGLTTMDLAIESGLLEEYDKLKADGESAGAAGGGAAGQAAPAPAPAGGAGAPGAEAASQANDSRRDEWAQVQRTEINEIKLRILVQDEDSKINVLNLLNPDEKEAQAAFDRVVRCLDMCRDGTEADIPTRGAEEMTRAMLEYMQRRNLAKVPRPKLLSDTEQNEEQGLPTSLEEFVVLTPFDESLFRDYRDSDGRIVHSIGSFLTVWSSLTTQRLEQDAPSAGAGGAAAAGAGTPPSEGGGAAGQGGAATPGGGTPPPEGGAAAAGQGGAQGGASGGQGAAAGGGGPGGLGGDASTSNTAGNGWAVNVNTAPVAVLKALFDDRELRPRFWDKVIEYRNLEEEEEEGGADEDEDEEEQTPTYDEFGNEVIQRRIFESLGELQQVDGFEDLESALQQRVRQMLTTQSQVFSIYIVARRSTSSDGDEAAAFGDREQNRIEEEQGDALVRVVRSVVWRRTVGEEVEIVPLLRWEYLDYLPFEVVDYPDDER